MLAGALALLLGGSVLTPPSAIAMPPPQAASAVAPSRAQRIRARLSELVYSEKPGERVLAERVGVRTFSKYWLNGGSWWSRQKWWPLRFVPGRDRASIVKYIKQAKLLETIHLVEGPIVMAASAYAYASGHSHALAVPLAANFIANAYPVLSNRFNRFRAERLLRRMDASPAPTQPASE
jgi:hypothetical protein